MERSLLPKETCKHRLDVYPAGKLENVFSLLTEFRDDGSRA